MFETLKKNKTVLDNNNYVNTIKDNIYTKLYINILTLVHAIKKYILPRKSKLQYKDSTKLSGKNLFNKHI